MEIWCLQIVSMAVKANCRHSVSLLVHLKYMFHLYDEVLCFVLNSFHLRLPVPLLQFWQHKFCNTFLLLLGTVNPQALYKIYKESSSSKCSSINNTSSYKWNIYFKCTSKLTECRQFALTAIDRTCGFSVLLMSEKHTELVGSLFYWWVKNIQNLWILCSIDEWKTYRTCGFSVLLMSEKHSELWMFFTHQ
jgi:hypothetical protein